MIDFLKTYNTVGAWTLIVAVATLIVTIMSYRYTRKRDKKNKIEKIRRKQAQIQAMEEGLRWGVEVSAASHLRVEIAGLKAELEQLKSEL